MADEPRKPRRPRIRSGPTMGPKTNVSVPISFGLPLIAVGIALLVAATRNGAIEFWASGAIVLILGLALFASGKTL